MVPGTSLPLTDPWPSSSCAHLAQQLPRGEGRSGSTPRSRPRRQKIKPLDNRTDENDLDGEGWVLVLPAGLSLLGGLTISAPAAVSYHENLYLFIRGIDNRVYFNADRKTWLKFPTPAFSLPFSTLPVD
jgi:hypothetical protein